MNSQALRQGYKQMNVRFPDKLFAIINTTAQLEQKSFAEIVRGMCEQAIGDVENAKKVV